MFTPETFELSPERKKALIDKIATEIVKRGLETPAIMFLETIKPLAWVGAELSIVYVMPFVKAYIQHPIVDEIVALFHDRDAIEQLIRRIEELVELEKEKEKALKEARKREKQLKQAGKKKRRWWIFG